MASIQGVHPHRPQAQQERPGDFGTDLAADSNPESPEDAAKEFEHVFVRQFVDVMTKDMFSSSLEGGNGHNWMSTQRDRQRDMMTDMITDQIVEAGNLGISETLLRRWKGEGSPNDTPTVEELKDPMPTTRPNTLSPPTSAPTAHEGSHVDHTA